MNRLLTLLAGLMLIVGTAQAQTTAPSTEGNAPDSNATQSPNWNSNYDSYQTYPDESRTTGSSMSMDNSMVTPTPAPTDMDESTMTSTTASMDSSRATGSSTKNMGKKKKSHKRPGSTSSPEASPHTGTSPSSGTTTNPDSGSSNP